MLQVDTYLNNSDIHGIGLFANQKIKQGDFVWVFDPAYDRRFRAWLVNELLPFQKRDIWQRCYINPEHPEFLVLCGDEAKFINFDLGSPNLKLSTIKDHGEYRLIAARDIEEREELTVGLETDLDSARKITQEEIYCG